MVCSFCTSDEPRVHNVRTCKYLKAAIAVFIGYKGATMTLDSFQQACVGVVADLVFTGGMATVATCLFEAYKNCVSVIDITSFLTLTKKNQAKELLETGNFGNMTADAVDGFAVEFIKG
jgi:hypothetical protein